jgi:hypothetical protein
VNPFEYKPPPSTTTIPEVTPRAPVRHVATTLTSSAERLKLLRQKERSGITPHATPHVTTKAPAKKLAATVANAQRQAMLARRQGSR